VRDFININENLLYQAIQNWSWINQRVLGSHLKLGQTPGEVFFPRKVHLIQVIAVELYILKI
jgi:hypothetical protein